MSVLSWSVADAFGSEEIPAGYTLIAPEDAIELSDGRVVSGERLMENLEASLERDARHGTVITERFMQHYGIVRSDAGYYRVVCT